MRLYSYQRRSRPDGCVSSGDCHSGADYRSIVIVAQLREKCVSTPKPLNPCAIQGSSSLRENQEEGCVSVGLDVRLCSLVVKLGSHEVVE